MSEKVFLISWKAHKNQYGFLWEHKHSGKQTRETVLVTSLGLFAYQLNCGPSFVTF